MENTLKLLIYAVACLKNINITDDIVNKIYITLLDIRTSKNPDNIEITKKLRLLIIFDKSHRQMKFLMTLMSYIDAIMAKGKSDWAGVQAGLKGTAVTLGNVKDKFNYRLNPIEYLFGIHGALLVRYLTQNNATKGAKILKSETNSFTNAAINAYLLNRTSKNMELETKGTSGTFNNAKASTFLNTHNLNKVGLNKKKNSKPGFLDGLI